MKVRAGDVDSLCARPPEGWRAVLLYGPDSGLVSERLRALTRAIAGDPDDSFRVSDLDASEIGRSPGRLLDEAAQLSLDGGPRAVRVRNAGDGVASAVEAFLEAGSGAAKVLVEAGDLRPQSRLRKLFERAKDAAAAPSYADDPRAVGRLVDEAAREAGVSIERDARTFLVERLGRDRGVSRSEIAKIVLYAGPGGSVGYEDALALTGDNALLGMDELADAAGLGRAGDAFRALGRLEEEGQRPVGVARGLLRHFQRLHAVSLAGDVEAAAAALRPPVHFRRKEAFLRQARRWGARRTERALALLVRAEVLCKGGTGAPDGTVIRETVLRISRLAPPPRGA